MSDKFTLDETLNDQMANCLMIKWPDASKAKVAGSGDG